MNRRASTPRCPQPQRGSGGISGVRATSRPAWALTGRLLLCAGASTMLLCGNASARARTTPDTQDRVGEIVQPATGTDRAVYVPLTPTEILPHFIGTWATRGSKCIGQHYTHRMELRADLAVIAGHALTVQEVSAEGGQERDEGDDLGYERAQDHADADDMVVGLLRSGETDMRRIHLWFSYHTGRLILEEVGKPRKAYVRCTI